MFPARSAAVAALLLLSPAAAHAQGAGTSGGETLNFPAHAASTAMNMLFINPPLPLLKPRAGDWKVALQPYYFTGEVDPADTSSGFSGTRSGDFKGWGGGVAYSRGLGEKWSLHLLVMGASVTEGDFRRVDGAGTVDMTGAKASYVMAAPMLARRFGRGRVTWGLFFGPTVTKLKVTSSVLETTGGAVKADWDAEISKTLPGPSVGLQAGFDVGRFTLNPFAILGGSFGNAGPKPTAVRTDSGGALLALAKGTGTGPAETAVGTGGASLGVNVLYQPWGLSVNVTAPLLRKAPIWRENASKGIEVTQFSLSWSFGSYQR